MPTVNEIKDEFKFNEELTGLIGTMKDTAVFQFRHLQRETESVGPWDRLLDGFFGLVDMNDFDHPFLNPKTERSAILIVTSDEGFMGGLNLKVIDAALSRKSSIEPALFIVGERGARYLDEKGLGFKLFTWSEFKDRQHLALALQKEILKGALESKFGAVEAVYPQCASFMVQRVATKNILPLTKNREPGTEGVSQGTKDIIIETPLAGIVEFLAENAVFRTFSLVLEQSKLSEYAARAIHLEKSDNELVEKGKQLMARYFHAHREVIDQGTREVFSSRIIRKAGSR